MHELSHYKTLEPITGPVRIDVTFTFNTKDVCSPAIGDLDNLLKAVWDGLVLTGIISDDKFIVATYTKKEIGDHDQTTVCAIALDPQDISKTCR